jgi:general secretion pathway protein A
MDSSWNSRAGGAAVRAAFLYPSTQHQEAMAHLLYGARGGGGFVLLTGNAGVGKTQVLRCFLRQLPKPCVVAVVGGNHRHALALLQTVCTLYGLALPGPPASAKLCMDALNAFLLSTHAQGRQALLIVDDAHRLSAGLLELLRLLTNLETSERKLLQIVLVGRSELRDRLAEPTMEQLAQRVTARHHMTGLSAQGVVNYVEHWTQAAGRQTPLQLNRAALTRLHRLSSGAPLQINRLVDRALKLSSADSPFRLTAGVIGRAADEIYPSRRERQRQMIQWGWAGLCLVLLLAGLALALEPWWPTSELVRR